MGNSLELTLIAEDVETEAQALRLRQAGCHEGQGYLYSKPVLPDEIDMLFVEDTMT